MNLYLHDVIRDVERKKERHLRQRKNVASGGIRIHDTLYVSLCSNNIRA